jgi:hypothetical protein
VKFSGRFSLLPLSRRANLPQQPIESCWSIFQNTVAMRVISTKGSPQVAQPHQSLKISPFGRDDRKNGVYSKKKNALRVKQPYNQIKKIKLRRHSGLPGIPFAVCQWFFSILKIKGEAPRARSIHHQCTP